MKRKKTFYDFTFILNRNDQNYKGVGKYIVKIAEIDNGNGISYKMTDDVLVLVITTTLDLFDIVSDLTENFEDFDYDLLGGTVFAN